MTKRGSIIIITMWTMFFLGALVVAVAARVDAGLKVASLFKTRIESSQLARAGVEKGIIELLSDTNSWDGVGEAWCREDLFKNIGLGSGSFSVWHKVVQGDGSVTTVYGMSDEESRINITKATPQLLNAFAMTAGGLDSAAAADMAASIVDWRDQDDDMLTGGAEKNYYEGLSQPIRCHNGDFQSVYELLFVKGMTPALFERLEPHMTIYGTGKVNVNTADAVVLASVGVACGGDSGVAMSLAKKIVAFTHEGNALTGSSPDEITTQLRQSVAGNEQVLLRNMMSYLTLQSTCFGGTAEGRVGSGAGAPEIGNAKRVEFVFDRVKKVKVSWYEN
jgi:type II secretory pathway component PulK